MILKTEYKKLQFTLEIEKEHFQDYAHMMGDKFNRLPPQTLLEITKGNLCSYNILIESQYADETYTHYLSSVLLTSKEEELVGELGEYLDQEETFEEILKLRNKYAVSPGPEWRQSSPIK